MHYLCLKICMSLEDENYKMLSPKWLDGSKSDILEDIYGQN